LPKAMAVSRRYEVSSLCPRGGIRLVRQNQEVEKISSEIFDADVEEPDGSSPVSGLMTLNTPESVKSKKII
jgi:hypothetical protein